MVVGPQPNYFVRMHSAQLHPDSPKSYSCKQKFKFHMEFKFRLHYSKIELQKIFQEFKSSHNTSSDN